MRKTSNATTRPVVHSDERYPGEYDEAARIYGTTDLIRCCECEYVVTIGERENGACRDCQPAKGATPTDDQLARD